MEQIIIRILEPAAEVWLLTEVMAGRERFIILKIRRSVQNLKKMLNNEWKYWNWMYFRL